MLAVFFSRKLVPELPPKELIIQHYCRIRGLSYPIPNWNFFLALNLFKLASITQVKRTLGNITK